MSSWAVVLPVKPWATAKSRLTSDPAIRADLARAFTLDVIAATRSTPGVAGIVVVTSEPTLSVLLSAPVPARHGGGSGQLAEVVVVDDPAAVSTNRFSTARRGPPGSGRDWEQRS
jgi:2-phospho-L-lactate guanylyltransferase (CobY/MobA/RfbA family)